MDSKGIGGVKREVPSERALRAAMPNLPPEVGARDVHRLARWAGMDAVAREIAARGAARLGVEGWLEAYDDAPEVWLGEFDGGRTARRLKRGFGALADAPLGLLRPLVLSPTGLRVTTVVATEGPSQGSMGALRELLGEGWAARRGRERVEVPPMRRALLRSWMGPAEPATMGWLARYTKQRLGKDDAWDSDDRACLAACFGEGVADELAPAELVDAALKLRRTPHIAVAIRALKRHLSLRRSGEGASLKRALGVIHIDIGEHSAGMRFLRDESRASNILCAHAHVRMGNVEEGQRVLRSIGPRREDIDWELQWAFTSTHGRQSDAESLLGAQLDIAEDSRHRGLVWSLYGEWADRRGDSAAVGWYRRAIADLCEAGDDVGVTYAEARYARALVRNGQVDAAAEAATSAWHQAKALPGVTLRGFAALACLEAGVATEDVLQGSLRAAASAEFPELAADAARAIAPSSSAIVGLGATHASIDGVPLSLKAKGPTWRVFEHLCRLPSASIVSLEELFAAGWPGDRVGPESQRKRVHTAIWTLRRAGLRDVLVTVSRNRYRLQAQVVDDGGGIKE